MWELIGTTNNPSNNHAIGQLETPKHYNEKKKHLAKKKNIQSVVQQSYCLIPKTIYSECNSEWKPDAEFYLVYDNHKDEDSKVTLNT